LLNRYYDFDQLKINKNILIFKCFEEYFLNYTKYSTDNLMNNLKIKFDNKKKFNLYIEEYLIKDKLIGNIILKELTQKVFHPNRLLKICNTYNIEFDKLLEIY
jgi:hypothetical protein